MTYVLARTYEFDSSKNGRRVTGKSYFVEVCRILGAPMGSSRLQDARKFNTRALAEVYARNKLPGRGYKAERVKADRRQARSRDK